jgi:hypothetical protein
MDPIERVDWPATLISADLKWHGMTVWYRGFRGGFHWVETMDGYEFVWPFANLDFD